MIQSLIWILLKEADNISTWKVILCFWSPLTETETKRHEESKIRLLWMPRISNCIQLCSFNVFFSINLLFNTSTFVDLSWCRCRREILDEKFWTKLSLRWEGPHRAHKPICGAVFWNLHIIWFICSCWPLRAQRKIWSLVKM